MNFQKIKLLYFYCFKIDLCEKIWIFPQIALPLQSKTIRNGYPGF